MKTESTTELDHWYPPCGPCGFCGFHDKRHRLWDTWIDIHDAGGTAEELAKDYDEPLEYVQAVLRLRPYQDEDE